MDRERDEELGSSPSLQQNGRFTQFEPISSQPSSLPYRDKPNTFNELSDDSEDPQDSNILDENTQSIIGVSISKAATRLKSPATPAAEKAAALEGIEGGGLFDSDQETPQLERTAMPFSIRKPFTKSTVPRKKFDVHEEKGNSTAAFTTKEKVTSPRSWEKSALPEPWHAGPRPFVVQNNGQRQSPLHGVFDLGRKRSLSASADALRKFLPKGLPTMAHVGHMLNSKSGRTSPTLPKESQSSNDTLPGNSSPNQGRDGSPESGAVAFKSQVTPPSEATPQRPKVLRHSTSDNSLLYSSLSRASSLGDDSRFANQREQVNSRVKAIRDSLQDRSTFKMPQLPSMPRVPSFGFNLDFLTSTSPPARGRQFTNPFSDILPAATTKKKPNTSQSSFVAPGIDGDIPPKPEKAIAPMQSVSDGSVAKYLERAMGSLTGDVVLMGGYRGSVLRLASPPNRQVWVPVKVGLNIRKVNLEVGLGPEDEERMEDSIYPSGMLQNIGPIDISKRLFKGLRHCENARNGKLRVWDFGYDWRLSPHLLSRKLKAFLEKLPSNQSGIGSQGGALVIAHSLGGLITRHVANQRPELFSGIIYAGTPNSCVNILGPIRNGDAVLLSSRVLTAQVNFTLRSSFALLPLDGRCFVDINTGEDYPVDFFNVDDWTNYRWSPCTDSPLPPKSQTTSPLSNFFNLPGSLLSLPLPLSGKSSNGNNVPQPQNGSTAVDKAPQDDSSKASRAADTLHQAADKDRGLEPQMNSSSGTTQTTTTPSTITIPRDKAIAYLRRTLAEIKQFKQECLYRPELNVSNRYPPLAVMYGKSIPTCNGAKVDGRDGIARADAYDNLAFASGDGVVLAREAMLPEGYKAVHGGIIRSDRGHVSLLGDLSAVGKAIEAVVKGRSKGIGLGVPLEK